MTVRKSAGKDGSAEQGAFMALIDPHAEALSRLALRLTQSQVDGRKLVQYVMDKLYVHRYRVVHIRDLRPWLFKVMFHQFTEQLGRSRRLPQEHSIDEGQETVEPDATQWVCEEEKSDSGSMTGPEQCAFKFQLKDFLDAALNELSTHPACVVQHDLEGLTLPQIAERYAVSVHTLRSALTRARAQLRTRLEQFELVSAKLSGRRGRSLTARLPADRSCARRMRRRRGGGGGQRGQASR